MKFGLRATSDQHRNLALIFELYSLEDAAAEIVLASENLFHPAKNELVLNFLTGKLYGKQSHYRDIIEAFMADPIRFHTKVGKRRS